MKYLPRQLAPGFLILTLAASAAFAQRPPSVMPVPEKPWPRVAFRKFLMASPSPPLAGRAVNPATRPLTCAARATGSGRIFIAERLGKIFILQDGKLLPEPFLDITPQNTDQERGC